MVADRGPPMVERPVRWCPVTAISVLSTEYLRYVITTTVGGVHYNPTSDHVQFAFPAQGQAPATWVDGSWETLTAPTEYVARCLIGPSGAVTLTAGTWDVWIKITDSPEIPVRYADTINIT